MWTLNKTLDFSLFETHSKRQVIRIIGCHEACNSNIHLQMRIVGLYVWIFPNEATELVGKLEKPTALEKNSDHPIFLKERSELNQQIMIAEAFLSKDISISIVIHRFMSLNLWWASNAFLEL